MATLVLGAVGTLVGGPIGGAIGALLGQQVDRAIIGSPHREGPRLQDLKVTTSSYGTPIARHHGRMRVAGSVIWATDLKEASETSGGVTTYTYSVSFAVALSSRPILEIGRIWADGNLLRGAAGDLKAGGILRIYDGFGDQPADPLIASDKGAACPAFRHTAYAVFEDLQLADFGNRIPALTFEIVADEGEISLADVVACSPEPVVAERELGGLRGFSVEGGSLSDTLGAIDTVYPLAFASDNSELALVAADAVPADPPLLPEAAAAQDEQSFAPGSGFTRQRGLSGSDIPDALRYYDVDRDFQAGLQRADGRARPGRGRTIEFPGALAAADARSLINAAAERAGWERDTLAWRMAELDGSLGPGAIVRVPAQAGVWRITAWEWRDQGIELELLRLPPGAARRQLADPGTMLAPLDLPLTPTSLEAFELPWDGVGTGNTPTVFAAAGSTGEGWRGAALYAERGGELIPLGGSGPQRSMIGKVTSAVPSSRAMLFETSAALSVELLSEDLALAGTDRTGIANGANRARIGNEVIQFASATPVGGGIWHLAGLLRGRDGTEAAAEAGHPAGTAFVLLDGKPVALDPAKTGAAPDTSIVAIGLGNAEPVNAPIANPGLTLRPLVPVYPRADALPDGSMQLSWTRRARGAWSWPDEVEIALGEEAEAYRVGLGQVEAPALVWNVDEPTLVLDAAIMATLKEAYPGVVLWVRQVGSFAVSDPLLLTTLP